jgi:hypothetical protein
VTQGEGPPAALARVSESDAAAFLATYHGEPVRGLELLRGGFWSAAYGYSVAGRELVARFGRLREGFEMDRAAMAFGGPELPVPEVVDVGDAFDGAFAISIRHHGLLLEDINVSDAIAAATAVDRLLGALRAAGSDPDAPSVWYPIGADRASSTWRRWLRDGLVDDPTRTVSGWRRKLAERPDIDTVFEACAARVRQLVEACPERRDLVHGDLLHQNVMLTDDLDAASAVFSWKCSVRGDSLFDVAWCTFWSPWHPGIAAIDLWNRTSAAADIGPSDLVDAALRHHCYELHIGCTHLGWNAWTGNADELDAVARHAAHVLERGPLPTP